ncbi:hypothetical protein Lal_00021827 [Lupinus albus]|nr:hypothetical protein Lal_00021827 [Lupinus albus]
MSHAHFHMGSGSRSIAPRTLEFGKTHVVRPKEKHEATIVWLHGLGDNGLRRGASLVALHSSHTTVTMELLGGWRFPGRSLVQQVVSEPMVRLKHCGLKGEQTGKCVVPTLEGEIVGFIQVSSPTLDMRGEVKEFISFGSRRGASLVALHSSHTTVTMELLGGWRFPGRNLVQQVVSEPMVRLKHCGLKGERTGNSSQLLESLPLPNVRNELIDTYSTSYL